MIAVVGTRNGDVYIKVRVVGPVPTLRYSNLLVVVDEDGFEYVIEANKLKPYPK